MRILLDLTSAPRQLAGAGRYAYELARALAAAHGSDELILLDRWGACVGLADGRQSPVRVLRPRLRSRLQWAVWEQSVLPALARSLKADVLHSTHHSLPLLGTGCTRVVTIHDLNFLLLPERYPRARRLAMQLVTAAAVHRAQALIVPSRTVASDLRRFLRVQPERIHVIPEAAASIFSPQPPSAIASLRVRLRLAGPYVLSVGTLEPGKNRTVLLRAFAELCRRGLPQTLVIAGQRGWLQSGLGAEVERLSIAGRVRFLGYVPDADLPALYCGAELFVFPSLREGFGLPPLEAMACGTPVVASDSPALPEVLGDAALYAPALDAEALAVAMEQALVDEPLRLLLRERGLVRSAGYSWPRAAAETLAVYRQA